MATMSKRNLSGSTDGRQIEVTAIGTPGTLIHTATSSTTAGTYDEIWLYAVNNTSDDVELTIEFGGTTSYDDLIVRTIPSESGHFTIVSGLILQNSSAVSAFAGTTGTIFIGGYVNAITD